MAGSNPTFLQNMGSPAAEPRVIIVTNSKTPCMMPLFPISRNAIMVTINIIALLKRISGKKFHSLLQVVMISSQKRFQIATGTQLVVLINYRKSLVVGSHAVYPAETEKRLKYLTYALQSISGVGSQQRITKVVKFESAGSSIFPNKFL